VARDAIAARCGTHARQEDVKRDDCALDVAAQAHERERPGETRDDRRDDADDDVTFAERATFAELRQREEPKL
jgi:hypothetical protein